MTKSSRFAVAAHILTLLAYEAEQPLTSHYIAGSVNTNPVVIRRVLGLLSKAGLVSSSEGASGGTILAMAAESITLADVYHAVEPGDLFSLPKNDPNPQCPVGRCVQTILAEHMGGFQEAIDRAMQNVSIADLLGTVKGEGS